MAGAASEKSILTLIRDFASEKYEGERRVGNLKKRIQDLGSEVDRACEDLENAKGRKERVEQELKGFEMELAMAEASSQALEAGIFSYQNDIFVVRSEVQALKNEEGTLRDEFIKQMLELNDEIRSFQELLVSSAHNMVHADHAGPSSGMTSKLNQTDLDQDGKSKKAAADKVDNKINDQDAGDAVLEEQLSNTNLLTTAEEKNCEEERKRSMTLQRELSDAEHKLNLMETIIQDMKELQDFTRQTSELETVCTELSEELQRKCVCPGCRQFNAEALQGMLQAAETG